MTEQEINHNALLSNVPIQNLDDVTEVAIKTKTKIGDIFLKGYSEYYRTIGVENLGIKDKNGNFITKLDGGKQKNKAKEIITQYIKITNRPDLKNYAIQISDIFDIPVLKDITKRRGRKNFYKDKIIPLMIKYLLFQGNINTTIDKLSKKIGMVGNAFKYHEYENELLKNNDEITIQRINKFYSYCKPEQERILFDVLDSLENNYSVITYKKNFLLIDIDGNEKSSTENETIKIRMIQRKVLDEFGASSMFSIFQKGIKTMKKFYNRVCEVINDEMYLNCKAYYNQIQIYADMDGLKNLDLKLNLDNEECKMLKNEIRQHFLSTIKNRIKNDYEYNQQSADKKDAESMKEWEENTEYKNNIPHDMQELIDIGVYSENDVKTKLLPKPKPAYRYPENHIEILYYLCDCLLTDI